MLLDYVCSPVPFVVGVLSSHLDYINSVPKEEVVIVRLDTGKIIGIPNVNDVSLLPPVPLNSLKTSLKNSQQSAKSMERARGMISIRCLLEIPPHPNILYIERGRIINQEILDSFLQFFVAIFHNYKSFIQVQNDGQKYFDTEKFIGKANKQEQAFLKQFSASQMFERWSAEHEKTESELKKTANTTLNANKLIGQFERECNKFNNNAQNIKQ